MKMNKTCFSETILIFSLISHTGCIMCLYYWKLQFTENESTWPYFYFIPNFQKFKFKIFFKITKLFHNIFKIT